MLLNSAQDPNNFWTNLKKIFPSKQKDPTKRFTINSVTTADTNTIVNAFSTFFSNIVSKLKLKTYVLKNCVWRKQTFESLRTCKKFSFKKINEGIVYSELCKLKGKKSSGIDDIPPAVLKDAADVLAKPLAKIINISLETGVFPSDWKTSKLTPIYKSGARDCIENYRPISIISAISKIIEKIVHRQLSAHLENNSLLNEHQFGFRKRRSTELA